MPGRSPPKKKVRAKSRLVFNSLLSSPHASLTLPSFGSLSFSLTIGAKLKKGKISDFGFVSKGSLEFNVLLSKGCALFVNKTQSEAEHITLDFFFKEMNASSEEKMLVLYAWTALQDIVSRLPFDDPLSLALSRLHFLNREFKYGTLLPDLED